MADFFDRFSGGAGALNGHVADSGDTWVDANSMCSIDGSGSIYTSGTFAVGELPVMPWTPPSADYSVSYTLGADMVAQQNQVGMMLRQFGSTPTLTYYSIITYYDTGVPTVALVRVTGGAPAQMGAVVTGMTWAAGDVITVSVSGSGPVTLNGYQNGTLIITRTDVASPFTFPGGIGPWITNSTGTDHMRTMWAGALASGPPAITIAPTSATLAVSTTQSFALSTALTNETFAWSATHGSISGSLATETYTAPGSGTTDSVTGASVDLPTRTATASITLTGGTTSLSASPALISTNATTTVTWTGTGTTWTGGAPTFTPSGVAGVSCGTVTVVSDTSAHAVVTVGIASGTLTWTDSTTSATTTQTVERLARRFTSSSDAITFASAPGIEGSVGFAVHMAVKFDTGSTSFASDPEAYVLLGTSGDAFALAYRIASGVKFLWFYISNGTSGDIWQSMMDPFSAYDGDPNWHYLEVQWSKWAGTGDFNGYLVVTLDGANVPMHQPIPTAATTINASAGTLSLGNGEAMVGLSIADFGIWALPSTKFFQDFASVFDSTDLTNFSNGFPAEVIQVVGSPSPQQDVVPITGANPEVGILNVLSGTVTGTTVVGGPPTFPPFAAVCTLSQTVIHTPGTSIATFRWLRDSAPSSSVTFTPTTSAGTFSPATVTLTASGGAMATTTLTVPIMTPTISYTIAVSNPSDLLPLSVPFTVELPRAQLAAVDGAVIPPSGEFILFRFVRTSDSTVTAVTGAVNGAASVTINGGSPITLDTLYGYNSVDNTLWAALPTQDYYEEVVDDVDAACTLTAMSGWTQDSDASNGNVLWITPPDVNDSALPGSLSYTDVASDTAVYHFTGLAPGYDYQVRINQLDTFIFGGSPGQYLRVSGTTHAQYLVKDGSGSTVGTFALDQTVASSFDGVKRMRRMSLLGTVTNLTTTTATVTVSNAAGSGRLYTDGVQLKQVAKPVASAGDTVLLNADDLWVTTAAGTAGAVFNQAVTFKTKDDWFPYDPSNRTMKMGYNVETMASGSPGGVLANWATRAFFGGGSGSHDEVFHKLIDLNAGGFCVYILIPGAGFNNQEQSGQCFAPVDGLWYISFTTNVSLKVDIADPNNPTVVLDTFTTGGAGAFSFTLDGSVPRLLLYAPAVQIVFTNVDVVDGGTITNLVIFDSQTPHNWPHTSHPGFYNYFKDKGFSTLRWMGTVGTIGSNNVDFSDYPRDDKPQDANQETSLNPVNVVSLDPVTGSDLTAAAVYFNPNQSGCLIKVTFDAPPAKPVAVMQRITFIDFNQVGFGDTGGATSAATATASVSGGAVTGFTVTSGGVGYNDFPPDVHGNSIIDLFYPVTITGTGTGAQGRCVIDNTTHEVLNITVIHGGTGYTSPPTVTIATGSASDGVARLTTIYAQGLLAIPLTDTSIIIEAPSGSAWIGTSPSFNDTFKTFQTGFSFSPAPGSHMIVDTGYGTSLQNRVRVCNELNMHYWHNTGLIESDACVQAAAEYVAANLTPGLKMYGEDANEIWNIGPAFPDFGRAAKLGQPLGLLAEQYHGYRSYQQHVIQQKAFRDAGRPDDFIPVLGCGFGQGIFTTQAAGQILQSFGANAYNAFPNRLRIAIACYQSNSPIASGPGYPGAVGFGYSRLSSRGLLDLWALHICHQGYYDGLVAGHIVDAAPFSVKIAAYEASGELYYPNYGTGPDLQDQRDRGNEVTMLPEFLACEMAVLQRQEQAGWEETLSFVFNSGGGGTYQRWTTLTSYEQPLGDGVTDFPNKFDLRNAPSQIGTAHQNWVATTPTPTPSPTPTPTPSPAPWYDAAWNNRILEIVDNRANDAALSYYHVHFALTGAAYTAFRAHAKSDGSDLRVTDADGVTLLYHKLEGIDTVAEAVYIVAKVPRIPGAAIKGIYSYYANAAASSTSSTALTIASPVVGPWAIPTSTDVFNQSDLAGFNVEASTVCLKHQTGGNSGRNGYLISTFDGDATSNATDADSQLWGAISTDSGMTWTSAPILLPASGYSVRNLSALTELSNGHLVLPISNDTNALTFASQAAQYVLVSTDGGQTWSTGTSTAITLPFNSIGLSYGQIIERPNGDLWQPWYGIDSGDTGYHVLVLVCPNGSDPKLGASWGFLGGSKAAATVAFDNVNVWAEMTLGQIDANNVFAVIRNVADESDLWIARTTDGAATWSTPVKLGCMSAGTGAFHISPHLLLTTNGDFILSYLAGSPSPGGSIPGHIALVLSTDNGATWSTANPACAYMAFNLLGDLGYPSTCELPDKSLYGTYHYWDVTGGNNRNIAGFHFDADWVINPGAFYTDFETTPANWTLQAQYSLDGTQSHSGSQSLKVDQTANAGANNAYHPATFFTSDGLAIRRGAFHCWVRQQHDVFFGMAIGPDDGTSFGPLTQASWTGNDPSYPFYDPGAEGYLSSPHNIDQNVWSKVSLVWSTPTGTTATGVLLKNNVVQTSWSGPNIVNGGDPKQLLIVAGSGEGTHNVIANVDDFYVTQFATNVPVLTSGAEETFGTPTPTPTPTPTRSFNPVGCGFINAALGSPFIRG